MKNMEQTLIEAGRFYTIASASGFVIEAVENADNGADIRLGRYDRKPAQEWSFDRVGEDVYRIRNRANGKLMDLMMAGTANGTWLHLWEDVSGTSQMWNVEPNHEGLVRLRSQWAGGRCVDTVGMGCGEGAILQIWQETQGGDQLWAIKEVKERAVEAVEPAQQPAAPVEEAAASAAPADSVKEEAAPAAVEGPAAPAEEPVKEAAPAAEDKPAVPEKKAKASSAKAAKSAPKTAAKTTAKKKCATPRKRAAKKTEE